MERPAFDDVCIFKMVKVTFRREHCLVLFLYIVLLEVVLGETCLGAVCVHRNVKSCFWIDPLWVLFVYIIFLKVAFGETCDWCCLHTSNC